MGFFGDLWNMGTKNTNFDGYAPIGAAKQVGSDVVNSAKSPGYDTAAAGAKEAQAYLQQLSQTAWDRQMQGLQGALGSFQNYDALSKQLIPRHGGNPSGPGGPGGQAGLPPPPMPSTGPAIESRFGPGHFGAGNGLPGNSGGNAPGGLPPPPMPSAGPSTENRFGPGHFGDTTPSAAPPAPPALPPPGSPIGTPVSQTPGIMDLLAQMTIARTGRGHF